MSWAIRDNGERLVLHVDEWNLAGLVKETKAFELYFPLDAEDQSEAERMLLRRAISAE